MGESDYTPGAAELDFYEEDNAYEYGGSTEMFWDGQLNVNDVEASFLRRYAEKYPEIAARVAHLDAHIRVQCSDGHEWDTTRVLDDAPQRTPA